MRCFFLGIALFVCIPLVLPADADADAGFLDRSSRYLSRADETEARYALPLAQAPDDPALHIALAKDLSRVAYSVFRDKFTDQAVAKEIFSRALPHYEAAARLAPDNLEYLFSLAHCRIDLLGDPPGSPRPDAAPDIEAARQAFRAVQQKKPNLTDPEPAARFADLADRWLLFLMGRAKDVAVPAQEALDLPAEADALCAELSQGGPDMGRGRNGATYLFRRGEIAVIAARREQDPARRLELLGRSKDFFLPAVNRGGFETSYSSWVSALEPDLPPKVDAAFAQTLLREQLVPLKAYEAENPAGMYLDDLCHTLARLASAADNPQEARAWKEEGIRYCQKVLHDANGVNRDRARAALQKLRGLPE